MMTYSRPCYVKKCKEDVYLDYFVCAAHFKEYVQDEIIVKALTPQELEVKKASA